jgi:hypothetical protein
MRLLTGLCCAFALVVAFAPGVRADEYNKQTFLTFSGPVQLPGITLPAGTYMLKLADPDTGRRAIQVWDKDATKLYTTLLTIPNQRMEPPDQPVVMFEERPAGEAQAIKAWFYPGESVGQEFIYPKDQAMKIAKATHEPVLAVTDQSKNSDVASMKTAKVDRIDENGNIVKENDKASNESKASQTTASNATTTTAPDKETTGATSTASARNESAPAAVGTSGAQSAASARSNTSAPQPTTAPANRTRAADQPAGTAGKTLPSTASGLELMELFSALSLAGAFGTRRLRARYAHA